MSIKLGRKFQWGLGIFAAIVLGVLLYLRWEHSRELLGEAAAESFVGQLRWLDKADPIKDAKDAVAQRRYALMSVSGVMTTAPAFAANWKDYDKKYGFIMINGTSDVVMGTEHKRLIEKAYVYADQYNRYILEHADYGSDEQWRVK